jgi:inorganic pyrophosphatase
VTLTDFFKTYKNNKVKVGKMLNKTAALQLIKESLTVFNYKEVK